MFNDKLHIFTYKNTINQSKLKLLAIFGQSRFSSTVPRFADRHFHQQADSARAQFIIQRRSYLDWLEVEYSPDQEVEPIWLEKGLFWLETNKMAKKNVKFPHR
jgi:hypothetical protein